METRKTKEQLLTEIHEFWEELEQLREDIRQLKMVADTADSTGDLDDHELCVLEAREISDRIIQMYERVVRTQDSVNALAGVEVLRS